ncbi:hypothetical protein FIV11_14140 [Lactiplantibacillus plantarum]|uniref:hypothetical protein n=1 Tax=Lactiplantibacillus plantarum TaxID=1590 RepID=UPI00264EB20F|nr:hypothetical protein [Lactiplantibacillus plantarum]MDN7062848.1 hypothetical protein [Lactiplantibacillus plantarum]
MTTISVGDRVTYPSVMSAGQLIVAGDVGKVIAIKPDLFGKSSRRIAVVRTRGKEFEMFLSALKIVN